MAQETRFLVEPHPSGQWIVRDTEGSALVWAGRPISVLFFETESTATRVADRYNTGWRPSR